MTTSDQPVSLDCRNRPEDPKDPVRGPVPIATRPSLLRRTPVTDRLPPGLPPDCLVLADIRQDADGEKLTITAQMALFDTR
jgi:hypothetical protein